MPASKDTRYKDTPGKWLLAFTLLLSVFSFTGYSAPSQQRQNSIKQTELVVTLTSGTKRALSYKQALAAYSKPVPSCSFNPVQARQFSAHVATAIRHLSKQHFNRSPFLKRFQSRTLPLCHEDDPYRHA
jgi:hypothetical protein